MSRAHGCAGATLSRLVALVPKPRVNLTRFHGVFAPNSKHRSQETPAKRGKVNKPLTPDEDQTPTERREAMTWAKRLKRVFSIDIETCGECGGDIKIIEGINPTKTLTCCSKSGNSMALFAWPSELARNRAVKAPNPATFIQMYEISW